MKKIKFLKKSEQLIIVTILLVCIAIFIIMVNGKVGKVALVTYNGTEYARIKLNKDEIVKIDVDLMVTLQIADGKICFIDSHCPDKLCEGFGKIFKKNQYAICVPAGIAVQIVEN